MYKKTWREIAKDYETTLFEEIKFRHIAMEAADKKEFEEIKIEYIALYNLLCKLNLEDKYIKWRYPNL